MHIKVTRDGPYVVSGGVPLSVQRIKVDDEGFCHGWQEGERYDTPETYALCGCGRCGNEPFCDGSHQGG